MYTAYGGVLYVWKVENGTEGYPTLIQKSQEALKTDVNALNIFEKDFW